MQIYEAFSYFAMGGNAFLASVLALATRCAWDGGEAADSRQ
jgi:hypothetical protein